MYIYFIYYKVILSFDAVVIESRPGCVHKPVCVCEHIYACMGVRLCCVYLEDGVCTCACAYTAPSLASSPAGEHHNTVWWLLENLFTMWVKGTVLNPRTAPELEPWCLLEQRCWGDLSVGTDVFSVLSSRSHWLCVCWALECDLWDPGAGFRLAHVAYGCPLCQSAQAENRAFQATVALQGHFVTGLAFLLPIRTSLWLGRVLTERCKSTCPLCTQQVG